jgi:hypothetical protein
VEQRGLRIVVLLCNAKLQRSSLYLKSRSLSFEARGQPPFEKDDQDEGGQGENISKILFSDIFKVNEFTTEGRVGANLYRKMFKFLRFLSSAVGGGGGGGISFPLLSPSVYSMRAI